MSSFAVRRRRVLLLILFVNTFLFLLTYYPESWVPPLYFPVRAVPPSVPRPLLEEGVLLLESFPFETPADLALWQEKPFKGRTRYALASGGGFVSARSENACSGLYRAVHVDVTPDLFVEWAWRPVLFPVTPEKGRFGNRKQDDYSARLYLIFPAANYFKSDVIEYVWDERAEPGTVVKSPYSDRIQILVVRSGPPPAGTEWAFEKRNVLDDFRRVFGREPKRPLGIVAIMSDSDNTQTASGADFGPIRFYRKQI